MEKTYFLWAIWKSLTKRARFETGSGSVNQVNGFKDPDLYQNVTDPEHCRKYIGVPYLHNKVYRALFFSFLIPVLLSVWALHSLHSTEKITAKERVNGISL